MMTRAKPWLYLQDNEIAIRHMLRTVEAYLSGSEAAFAAAMR